MKNKLIIGVCCLILITVNTSAQKEKSSYLSVNVNAGLTSLNFSVSEIDGKTSNSNAKIGIGLNGKYNFYFNNNWGIGTGLGFSLYKSRASLTGGMGENFVYSLGTYNDDDASGAPRNFTLKARVENIEEKQSIFFVDIPLSILYQTRFSYGKWGAYGSLGVKILMPVSRKYDAVKSTTSKLNVSGFYGDNTQNFDMGAPGTPPVPQHGFGTVDNPTASLKWNGTTELKTGYAVTFEIGALSRLTNESDLFFGPYIDYTLNDLKNNNISLLSGPTGSYHPDANNNTGKGIIYNGLLNSNHSDRVIPFSFGVKIGVRFKL